MNVYSLFNSLVNKCPFVNELFSKSFNTIFIRNIKTVKKISGFFSLP